MEVDTTALEENVCGHRVPPVTQRILRIKRKSLDVVTVLLVKSGGLGSSVAREANRVMKQRWRQKRQGKGLSVRDLDSQPGNRNFIQYQ
jgi:hypothetical protein